MPPLTTTSFMMRAWPRFQNARLISPNEDMTMSLLSSVISCSRAKMMVNCHTQNAGNTCGASAGDQKSSAKGHYRSRKLPSHHRRCSMTSQFYFPYFYLRHIDFALRSLYISLREATCLLIIACTNTVSSLITRYTADFL